MTQRTTLLLLIPHLGGGGAERVTAILAARLNPRRYQVHLGIVTGGRPAPEFPGYVIVHSLGARNVRSGIAAILRLVWKVRPNAILSGMAHLNLLVLMLRPAFPRATRVLVRQNGAPQPRDAGRWTPALYRRFYRKADAVICQTREMAAAVQKAAGAETRVHVLANPLELEALRLPAAAPPEHADDPEVRLLAVGRLVPEKGFDLLLRAFAVLRPDFPSLQLTILGAGAEKEALQRLARELALNSSVQLEGYVEKPAAWLASASLFVLSSRREGLPNALLEAAAAALPIVATPAEGGLARLLAGKEGVWLARDVSAMALEEAIRSALRALHPGQRFAHAWIDEFRAERIIPQYEALIDSVLESAP